MKGSFPPAVVSMPDAEIVVCEDFPVFVRDAALMLGYATVLGPGPMRDINCEVLLRRADLYNLSTGNIEGEVQKLSLMPLRAGFTTTRPSRRRNLPTYVRPGRHLLYQLRC